jgi:hypothetical protein
MTDQRMRRSTAVNQVVGFVDEAEELHRHAAGLVDATLAQLWAGGAILEDAERIDTYDVVLVLDAPATDVTWLALHPAGESISDRLRLTKVRATWFLRSTEHGVHNHRLRELVRVWTPDGPDDAVLDRLLRGELAPTDISRPPDDATMAAQFGDRAGAVPAAPRHDARQLPRPRLATRSQGLRRLPEDHLWRGAQAVREITDTLTALRPRP